jgi:hypothetical protein
MAALLQLVTGAAPSISSGLFLSSEWPRRRAVFLSRE